MYIHEKFQGFSSKNGWVIAIGLLKFGVTAAAAAVVVVVVVVGGISIT